MKRHGGLILLKNRAWSSLQSGGRQVSSSSASQQALTDGFLEVREYDIDPGSFGRFTSLVEETADLRRRVLPVVGLFKPDIGGVLNSFTHMYHYKNLEERDMIRAKALKTPAWSEEYLPVAKGMMLGQRNALYSAARSIMDAAGSRPVSDILGQNAGAGVMIIEIRRYQLHPGYDTVPTILSSFEKGIPEKMAVSPDTELIFFGFTDIGMLNNVIEVWRYPSAAACMASRQEARKVQAWRDTIHAVTQKVQHFTSTFMYSMKGSPV